jgi:hypothetical protein
VPCGSRSAHLSKSGGYRQCGLHGLAQAKVGVGDDQLHAGRAAGLQRAQERRPKGAVLAVAHGEAEHLTVAVTDDSRRYDDGLPVVC